MKKNNIISDWLDQYGNPEIDKFVETQLNQNKMTAVEWLMQQLPTIDKYDPYYQNLFSQAKAMEKEQEERAYKRGQKHKKPLKDSNPINKYLKSE